MLKFARFALIAAALCLVVGSAWSTGSVTTGDAAVPIPDNMAGTFACQSLMVAADAVNGDNITDLTVTLGVDHSWVGDTTLQLTGPNCGPLNVYARPGAAAGVGLGDSSNLCSAMALDYNDGNATDAETMGAAEAGAACVGSAGPLSYFSNGDEVGGANTLTGCVGTSAVGSWMLCIDDAAAGDTGTLATWTLDVTTDPVELIEFSVD